MRYELETHSPSATTRVVTRQELPTLYGTTDDVLFTWNDGGDDGVMIVSVDEDLSTVSLLYQDTWYWLEDSDAAGLVEIRLCDQEAWVPAGAILPRRTGLDALLLADDVPALLSTFRWRPQ